MGRSGPRPPLAWVMAGMPIASLRANPAAFHGPANPAPDSRHLLQKTDTPASPTLSLDAMAARLRRCGHIFNDERRAVAQVLMDAREPLDAEQVWALTRAAGAGLSRTTARRTLTLLTQVEIAEVSARRQGRQVFRLRRDRPSIHMVRTDTGAIDEIHDAALAQALEDAARQRGYRLSGGVELRVAPLPAARPPARRLPDAPAEDGRT